MKRQLSTLTILTALAALVLYTFIPRTHTTQKPPHKTPPIKAICFDIGSVLLKRDIAKTLWYIGPKDVIAYMVLDMKNPLELENKALSIIDYMTEKEGVADPDDNPPTEKGHPISKSMGEWQTGKISNQQMLQKVEIAIHELRSKGLFESEREQRIALHLAQIIFDAHASTITRKENRQVTSLIPIIKAQHSASGEPRYKLLIFSNIDQESIPEVQQQFPELFSQFDDFIGSGNIGVMKPSKAFYKHALDKHHLKAHECVFLDDLEENVQSAQELGIHAIHLTKHNIDDVKKKLEQLGVLPAPA
ncbi:HAD family hydrolase [Candidatus Babeliales bacterium]|nr:HAD family hydrolase [Candidatus Babeliales bacterium]